MLESKIALKKNGTRTVGMFSQQALNSCDLRSLNLFIVHISISRMG